VLAKQSLQALDLAVQPLVLVDHRVNVDVGHPLLLPPRPRPCLLALAVQQQHHLPADPGIVGAEPGQHLRGHALPLAQDSQQDVLRADVVVIQEPGFLLGEHDHPPGPVGEPLEHPALQFRRGRAATHSQSAAPGPFGETTVLTEARIFSKLLAPRRGGPLLEPVARLGHHSRTRRSPRRRAAATFTSSNEMTVAHHQDRPR
jgi:hypothetical protein